MAWCAINESIFPLCLAPPCIKPLLPCWALCESPHPLALHGNAASALKHSKPPFCTHSPLRKYISLLSWMGRTKTLSAGTSPFLYLEKVTLNRQTLQSQPQFSMKQQLLLPVWGIRVGVRMPDWKRWKETKKKILWLVVTIACMTWPHIVNVEPWRRLMLDFISIICSPFWRSPASKRIRIMRQNITHFT